MKIKIFITPIVFCLNLFFFTAYANAQGALIKGPSDHVASPPTSSSLVDMILGSGNSISLKIGTAGTAADLIYQWYKLDSTGVKHLIQNSSNSAYTEATAGPGYYTYQLVMSNSNQCTSEISDPFKVYVLPVLNPTIAASSSSICSNGTSSSTLTTNPGSNKFSYLYQWSVNGSDISGATSATYAATTTTTNNSTYTVKVAYTLSTGIIGTASQMVNVVPVPSKPIISVGL